MMPLLMSKDFSIENDVAGFRTFTISGGSTAEEQTVDEDESGISLSRRLQIACGGSCERQEAAANAEE